MRALLVGFGLCACGAPPAAAPASPPAQQVAIPRLPHAEFTVVPAELLDDGVLARIPHRVRIRRFGDAWLVDREQLVQVKRDAPDTDVLFPVIGETRAKIRVAFEDDEARLAIWIPREDTWSVIAEPIELSDREGVTSREAGVWVTRGAPVELGAQVASRREVHLRDESVSISGYAPDAVLSNVWLAGAGDPRPTFTITHFDEWKPTTDPRPRLRLAATTVIRGAPVAGAPVIATILTDELIGVLASTAGEYRQIEITRPYARINGFVVASAVTPTTDEIIAHGSGTGHGFGMSHADKIDVPTGTCLYDSVQGEVVGVQSKPSTRLGTRKLDTDHWSMIYLGTHWMTASLYIRDPSDDPKVPQWESCTQPPHR